MLHRSNISGDTVTNFGHLRPGQLYRLPGTSQQQDCRIPTRPSSSIPGPLNEKRPWLYRQRWRMRQRFRACWLWTTTRPLPILLVSLLNSNGLSAKAAYSRREAIESALKSLPDFVLVDVIMDGIDGCGCRDSELRDYSNCLAGSWHPNISS